MKARLVRPGGRPSAPEGVGVVISVMVLVLLTVAPASAEQPDGIHGVFPSLQVGTAGTIGLGPSEARHGELTAEDAGRDWYSFEAAAGQSYIIEAKSRISFEASAESGDRNHVQFVEGHLADPSILEVVDASGTQVLSEHDGGGFLPNFARAFFTPDQDGTYRIAVGSGQRDRPGLGWYTISVRADDHADDYRTDPSVVIRPGQSVTGRIDSDVAPDDPRLNSWDWIEIPSQGAGMLRPHPGIESMDDRDVIRMEITETGWYNLSVTGGPPGVGIWTIFNGEGEVWMYVSTAPITVMEDHIFSDTYYIVVGTPFESSGNTGSYTVTLGERLVFDD